MIAKALERQSEVTFISYSSFNKRDENPSGQMIVATWQWRAASTFFRAEGHT